MMQGSRKRVLIVDSDEQLLMRLEHLLEDEGLETTTTWSAAEALDLARRQPYNVLVAGDRLMDLKCEELLRELQRDGDTAPVLILDSAVSQVPSIASYFLSLGAAGTARKRKLDEVLQTVKRLAESPTGRAARAA
jgi:DNA-binding response OmpR family regulator